MSSRHKNFGQFLQMINDRSESVGCKPSTLVARRPSERMPPHVRIAQSLRLRLPTVFGAVGTPLRQRKRKSRANRVRPNDAIDERAKKGRSDFNEPPQPCDEDKLAWAQPQDFAAQSRVNGRVHSGRKLQRLTISQSSTIRLPIRLRKPSHQQTSQAAQSEYRKHRRRRILAHDLVLVNAFNSQRASDSCRRLRLRGGAEALSNIAAHAGTTRARLTATTTEQASRRVVAVAVVDQGKGFDPATVEFGYGIRHSIIKRMTEIGGAATVDSHPGEGARIDLRWPA